MIVFLALVLVALIYITVISIKLGIPQRLGFVLQRISLEEIPHKAAQKYRSRSLFTCDVPARWKISRHKEQYPDPLVWSANRMESTIGLIASLLKNTLNLQKDDRVAIFKENHFDMHLFMQSVIRAGGVACPLNGEFTSEHVGPYLSHISSNILITDVPTLVRVSSVAGFGTITTIVLAQELDASVREFLSHFEAQFPHLKLFTLEESLNDVATEMKAERRGKKDPLYLVHTSGTTGLPKAVILRNGPQSFAVKGMLCYLHGSRNVDKVYMAVPHNHQAVILTFNALFLIGVPAHWTSRYDPRRFDAHAALLELGKGKFTGFFGFPNTYTQLKEFDFQNYNLSRMRFWGSTADASHEAVIRKCVMHGSAFAQLGIPIKGSLFLDAQGSSEVGTPSVLRYYSRFTKRFDRRIGKPGSTPLGPAIRIVTPTGELLPRGQVGRLEVRGKTVFDSYWNDPDLTSKSFHDRWFFTGDVARWSPDGHVVQLDREVDVILTKSGPVYSLPIEEILHKHRAVFDVCVYGFLQADGSTLPAAAVALRPGYDLEESALIVEFNAMLETRQQLSSIRIMPWLEFPFGVTGKTLKKVFRERSKNLK